MNNQWYINLDGKNKGPYSSLELQMLFDSREITSFTLCYNKSFKKWIPYFDAKLLFSKPTNMEELLENGPPSLPSLPELPNLPELSSLPDLPLPQVEVPVEKKSKTNLIKFNRIQVIDDDVDVAEENWKEEVKADLKDGFEDDFEDEFNPPAFDSVNNVINFKPKAIPEVEAQQVDEDLFNRPMQKLPTHIVFGSSVFILLTLVASFFLFSSNVKNDVIFKNISFDVLKQLQSVSQSSSDSKFYIKFGLDKNSEVVFGKSNLAMDAVVNAQFVRLNNDNLGDKVSFTSSAILRNGNVVFNELEFNDGEKIIEGEYEVKVKASSNSLWAQIKKMFSKDAGDYRFEEKTFLLPANIKDYENKIASIKATKKLVETEILNGLDQKLQTIDSILTSLALHYRLSLNKNYGRESSKEFESRYSSSAGPLLQSIILEDFESLLAKSEQRVELRQISGEVHARAKEISALSAQLSSELAKLSYITPKMRSLRREKLSELTSQNKEKINQVRAQIAALLNKTKSL